MNDDHPAYGERRDFYRMYPHGADGRPVNNGWSYANADTIDRAREWSRSILAKLTTGPVGITSVHITGEIVEWTYSGWKRVGLLPGEVIRGTYSYPDADQAKKCGEFWMADAMRFIHPRRFDGSCPCGENPPL